MKIIDKTKEISRAIKQAKRKIFIIFLALIVIIIGLVLVLSKEAAKYSLKEAIFYYKAENENSKLFYIDMGKEPRYLTILPSEEINPGSYKVPKHTYISHNGKFLIYFERVGEVPIGMVSDEENLMAYRIFYKPKYLDLKNDSIKNIEQNIDSGSLVFSPDDKEIAWVLSVEESTVEELEENEKKRGVWLSNPDGANARQLAILDEKVVLLQRWSNNYIYFWGIQGTGHYSLGKINIKTGQVEYAQPKYCLENLINCQNFRFSSSGELLVYEAGLAEENGKNIRLFIESFDGKKSWQILVANYISDRLWLPNEERIIYTEQVTAPKVGLREKIHLVNFKTSEDKEIYSGNYISQIFPDASNKYLYFLEKETDEKFNLVELNIEENKVKIIDSGQYNQLMIFSGI